MSMNFKVKIHIFKHYLTLFVVIIIMNLAMHRLRSGFHVRSRLPSNFWAYPATPCFLLVMQLGTWKPETQGKSPDYLGKQTWQKPEDCNPNPTLATQHYHYTSCVHLSVTSFLSSWRSMSHESLCFKHESNWSICWPLVSLVVIGRIRPITYSGSRLRIRYIDT